MQPFFRIYLNNTINNINDLTKKTKKNINVNINGNINSQQRYLDDKIIT